MRLFVAVGIPQNIKHLIARIRLTPFTGKPVGEENYHINLCFLGERADEKPLINALKTVHFNEFPLEMKGFSAFPSVRRPRVVFLQVFSPRLHVLQKKLSAHFISEKRARTNPTSRSCACAKQRRTNSPRFLETNFEHHSASLHFSSLEARSPPAAPTIR